MKGIQVDLSLGIADIEIREKIYRVDIMQYTKETNILLAFYAIRYLMMQEKDPQRLLDLLAKGEWPRRPKEKKLPIHIEAYCLWKNLSTDEAPKKVSKKDLNNPEFKACVHEVKALRLREKIE